MHVNPAAHGPEGLGHHHHHQLGQDWTKEQIKTAKRDCNEAIAHTHDPATIKALKDQLHHLDDPKFRQSNPYNQFHRHLGH